jgi:hypothetical protein
MAGQVLTAWKTAEAAAGGSTAPDDRAMESATSTQGKNEP